MTKNENRGTAERTPFEQVRRGILRALYEGRYVPGQRLAAPDLMRDFDVGRGTVREVLQRLASTGVVTIAANRGAQVRRLTRDEVSGILDVVEVLLGLAARGACGAMRDADVREGLERRYSVMSSCAPATEFHRFVEAREDFYRYLVASPGNAELQRVFPAIQVQIMRVQLRAFDRAADSTDLSDYVDLFAAILSDDPSRAESAGRAHVRRTLDRVLSLPDRAFEPGGGALVERPLR
ncbi:GntR family transcriptional regulator [Sphingomonas adhaesiva]|uniref:GntR family transcriptional regulator n=1 Tax=Sphingomonas adhaesiva TaxID=28212 RepID=UPI002FFC2BA6